jgi:nucleoside-diphosphate-sugar epimerase
MSELHTVFGASGALGSAVVYHLEAEGIPVRAVARSAERSIDVLPDGIDIVECDAMDELAVVEASRGSSVIYNCLYVGDQMQLVAGHLLSGAREAGARLVNPGNALVYGPLKHVPATEQHPQTPTSRRGQMRKALEDMLMEAHARGEVEVVIPRLPTLYGAHVHGTFISAVFESAHAGRKAWWFGRTDVPHDLIYSPDAAAACVLLATNGEAVGQVWHVPGAGPLTGEQFITLIYAAFDQPLKFGARGRTFFQFAGMVAPKVNDLVEVMYQFERPFAMDGSKFAAEYPQFQYTPHEIGVEDTADWYREYLATRA